MPMPPENNGWVRDHRKILDWPWFKNPNAAHLWEYCRLKASYQARRALVGPVEVDLLPGQFIYGRRTAADETGLSEQEIRTAAKHLIREGCLNLTTHSTNLFSVATVCNWERYQGNGDVANQPSNQALTNLQPTSNQPLTTDKKVKKEEEGKEGEETADLPPGGGKKVSEKPKKARTPDPHAEAFKSAYDATFPEADGYDWTTADFVQLAKWRKNHPAVLPDAFVEVARRHWGNGQFCSKYAKSIKGLCSDWNALAAWKEGLPLNGTNTNRRDSETKPILPPSDFSDVANDPNFIRF